MVRRLAADRRALAAELRSVLRTLAMVESVATTELDERLGTPDTRPVVVPAIPAGVGSGPGSGSGSGPGAGSGSGSGSGSDDGG